ncbi:MAG: HAMP domain-containing sensor histidine kinase [Bacteroidota bacterium]
MLTLGIKQLVFLNLKMQQKSYLLTGLCIGAMAILLGLQSYWIHKYYTLTKQSFEKEVNLAFEDAVKKEFGNRADSIAKILKTKLLDTNAFLLTGEFKKEHNRVVYTLQTKKDKKDKFMSSFSLNDLNVELKDNNKLIREKIATGLANLLRNEDLENHIVYYRTQELGKFMVKITSEMEFDTINLRPVLNHYLAERSIFVNYKFYTRDKDSTTNKSSFNPALIKQYPVITRALPTYRFNPGQKYVRIMFKDPFPYILSNMWLILCSSLFLVLLIAFCLQYLLQSLRKEKKLAAIKNDFISNITHEFKTPIATAMLAVEALNDKAVLHDQEKTTRYLKHAKNELKRISGLTDRILKLSLYENNRYDLKKEQIQVAAIIGEIIELHSLSKRNIKISFHNNTGVSTLMADKIQFQHAISNIIENAIKYGTEPIEVKIKCDLDPSYFIISIEDNGPGIASSEIPFVFDKFYRAKREDPNLINGYGLGLNYVKQIMDQHSGLYKLTSSSSGTELTLSWPL